MSSKILIPDVQWAQRSSETEADKCYLLLTINIPDCLDPKVNITSTSLKFSADSKGHVGDEVPHKWELTIDFFGEIEPSKSMHKIANGQHYFLKLYKKELGLDYWPRLTKEKVKYRFIKTDFDKWVDEDEQEEASEPQGMQGMEGMEGMDFSQMLGGAENGGGLDMEALRAQIEQSGASIGDLANN